MEATSLWQLTVRQIVDGIARREFTAREVMEDTLKRVDQVNDGVNALVSVQAESAFQRADELDANLAAGRPMLPLQGVPVSTKVNSDQRGVPTTNGTHFFAGRIPERDEASISNIRKSGAVLFARSNAPAMSMRWTTENDIHGRTLNPWDRERVPGGSSGGASVAVATGQGPIAHGNDGGGSLRMPAFCAGVVGLRPTVGRVPSAPSDENQPRPFAGGLLSVQGPIGRTVEDVSLLLAAMCAANGRDPNHVPIPFDPPANSEKCRIALCYDPSGGGIDGWTERSVRHAADALADAGYEVVEAAPPQFADAVELWHAIASHARNAMGPLIEQHGDEGARLLHRGVQKYNTFEPTRFISALDRRTAMIRRWDLFFQEFPLLLCPVMNGKPFTVGFDTGGDAAISEMFRLLAPLMPASALGYPAISVPTQIIEGLPGGAQLMAGRFEEARILHAARIVQGDFARALPIDPKFDA